MENKLTVGNLLDKNGVLVEKGYSNNLIKTYEKSRIKSYKLRIKESNLYYIGNDKYGFFIELANNSLFKFAEIGFYDHNKDFYFSKTYYKVLNSKNFDLSETDFSGENYFKNKNVLVSIKNEPDTIKIYAAVEKFDGKNDFMCDIKLSKSDVNSIVVASPFDEEKHFCYFQKSFNYSTEGFFRLENQIYNLDNLEVVKRWSRGVWPYVNLWYWGYLEGKIDNKSIRINLGEGISDTSSASENIIFFDNKEYKIFNVIFRSKKDENDNDLLMDEWKVISDDGVINLTFMPSFSINKSNNFVVASRRNNKVYGKFSGVISLENQKFQIIDFFGFIEKSVYRGWFFKDYVFSISLLSSVNLI